MIMNASQPYAFSHRHNGQLRRGIVTHEKFKTKSVELGSDTEDGSIIKYILPGQLQHVHVLGHSGSREYLAFELLHGSHHGHLHPRMSNPIWNASKNVRLAQDFPALEWLSVDGSEKALTAPRSVDVVCHICLIVQSITHQPLIELENFITPSSSAV